MSFYNRRKPQEKISLLSNELALVTAEISELKAPTPIDPVTWTRTMRALKGEQFTFEEREYLPPLYSDTSPRVIVVVNDHVFLQYQLSSSLCPRSLFVCTKVSRNGAAQY